MEDWEGFSRRASVEIILQSFSSQIVSGRNKRVNHKKVILCDCY